MQHGEPKTGIVGQHMALPTGQHDGVDSGKRADVPTEMADRLKALEHENRELHQANEILRKASAYSAQAELDRQFKR